MTSPNPYRLARQDLRLLADQHRQTQAFISLLDFLQLRAPFPVMDSFVASPDLLLYLANHVAAVRPGLVVECGSGVSTLVLARSAQILSPSTRIVALEHDPNYLRQTRQQIAMHGLDDYADIRLAPLAPAGLSDHETLWYDRTAAEDLTEIDLLMIDGPPAALGPNVRYPAVPLLHDRFSESAVILLDDAARPDEIEVADRWTAEELNNFVRSERRLSRGLIRWDRAPGPHTAEPDTAEVTTAAPRAAEPTPSAEAVGPDEPARFDSAGTSDGMVAGGDSLEPIRDRL